MAFNIKTMFDQTVYDHPVGDIELIETHISWVLLTGVYAYKIKKPVNFGFLDFSTLDKRKTCCEQELRLNRRLAAPLYIDVVTINLSNDTTTVSGEGDVIEYAVKMRQFLQSAQFDHILAENKLSTKHIDAIAYMIADFHQTTKVCDDSMAYGDKESVNQPVEENFRQINEHLDTSPYRDKLDALSRWCHSEFKKLASVFEQRKSDGFIRECHGDMHLRNLVWLDDQAMAFDCIEFNAALRWIDVMSEVAFLAMDLQQRQQPLLANHFLNRYLEITGDYDGLSVLAFYLCYRAMVRAKVNTLRLEQKKITDAKQENSIIEFESYLSLAITYTQRTTPKLIIMRGVSASGKSTVSQQLLEKFSAIRIRSDVERKRLFNVTTTDNTSSEVETGLYSTQASEQTYEKLAKLCSQIIAAGYNVIVDATFLKYEQRKTFQQLARSLAVAYIIVETTAPADVLQQRIEKRKNDVSDADHAVLEYQLKNWQPLQEDETALALVVDTGQSYDITALIEKISAV